MKNLLLIGNQGSFASHMSGMLQKSFNVELLKIPSDLDIEHLDFTLSTLLSAKNYFAVVFIGGETRTVDKMYKANFLTAKRCFDKCLARDLYFCYLSSLAAFGDYSSGTVSCGSKRLLSKDQYGQTKNLFDQYVKTKDPFNKHHLALYPASIIGSKSQGSSLEKLLGVKTSYPWLRYFRFGSAISFIHRVELSDRIEKSLLIEQKGDLIIANNITIDDVFKSKATSSAFQFQINIRPIFKICSGVLNAFGLTQWSLLKSLSSTAIYGDNLMDSGDLEDYVSTFDVEPKL